MRSEKIGKLVAGALDMPKDVVINLPKIVLNGDMEVFCGGYKGLYEYSDTFIKLSADGKIIGIKGSGLIIKSIENDEIIVSGHVNSVEFL